LTKYYLYNLFINNMGICISRNHYPSNNEVEFFNFDGLKCKCKVIDVYDGDTITVIIKLFDKVKNKKYKFNKYYKMKIRIYGIDTPEIKAPKSQLNRELEKQASIYIREYVKTLILNKEVNIECLKFGKFGRTLGHVSFKRNRQNIDLAKHLVELGFAKEYFGKTKVEFSKEELENIINTTV